MGKIGEKAEDIMSTEIITVHVKDSLHYVARKLADHDTSGAPVLDDIGRVVGIVSEHDIVSYLSTFDDSEPDFDSTDLPPLADIYLQASTKPVEEVMTKGVIHGTPDMAIDALARLMTENNINRIPIVVKGELVGMVSRIDILRNIGQVALEKI